MPRTFFSVWSERLPQPRQSPIKNIIKVCTPSNELVNLRVEGMIRTITQVYIKCSFYRHRHATQKLQHYIIFLCLEISFTSWWNIFFWLARKVFLEEIGAKEIRMEPYLWSESYHLSIISLHFGQSAKKDIAEWLKVILSFSNSHFTSKMLSIHRW